MGQSWKDDRTPRECGRCGIPVVWTNWGWRHIGNQHTTKACAQVTHVIPRGTRKSEAVSK
jgi:hypothetical protein